MSNIDEQLQDIVAEILEVDKEQLNANRDANFFKDLGIDSLLGLEVVATVERHFDIKIEDEEVGNLQTFNAILDLVKAKLDSKK